MREGHCPSNDDLRGYALGKLPEEQSASIAEHLRSCHSCVVELERLNDDTDPLVAKLRNPRPAESADSPELRDAVARILHAPPRRASEEAILHPGTMLREYRILEKIGAGGMGVVYRALHTRIEKVVAVKVISSKYVAHPEAISRFGREMKAAGRFQHPNIVQASDGGEMDGLHFLVMEFVPGENLSSRVRKLGPLSVSEACDAIVQAASGLQHAHEAGLVHRDIKPSNLLVTPQGVVKILDLGLALLRDEPEPQRLDHSAPSTMATANALTTTSHMLGTNDYIAPEQVRNAHDVDARADIYSLGCTLIFLLTGKPPERTIDGGLRLRTLRPDAPKELEAVVLKMLAQEPGNRFASAREVAGALERFIVKAPVRPTFPRSAMLAGGAVFAALLAALIWAATRHSPVDSTASNQSKATIEELPMPRIYDPRPPHGQLPMTEAVAATLRDKWSAFAKVEAEPTNSLGMKLALIPPGEFFIRPETRAQVRITRPYYIGRHEVTRKQFAAYVAATKKITYAEQTGVSSWDTTVKTANNATGTRSFRKDKLSWRNPGYAGAGDDDPVSHITWQEAVRFCEWLSAKEKRQYRLPTDAEWEWAARAGLAQQHPPDWLTNPDGGADYAWYYRSSGDRPHAVGLLKPNAWGLFDCLGNVREWCSDWYGEDLPGLSENPKGPKGHVSNIRVVRGGDYRAILPMLSNREGALHYLGSSGTGFRVVCEIHLP